METENLIIYAPIRKLTATPTDTTIKGTVRWPDMSRARLITALGALVALGPLTFDMYLPALPDIGSDLHVNSAMTQLTLTGTMVGLGLGQLIVGPISDSLGRRRPMMAGVVVHIAASLAITITPNIAVFGMLRAIQGVGAAAAMVVAMAVVRDKYTGSAAAAIISRLMLVMGVAPILAPSLGAAVLVYGSWRSVFGVLTCMGLLLVVAAVALPESLPPRARRNLEMRAIFRTYRDLLHDKVFVLLVLVSGLSLSGLFAYLAGAPFIFLGQYGMTAQVSAITLGAGAIVFAASAQLNVMLLKRFEPQRIVSWSLLLAMPAALALLVLAAVGWGGLAGFVVPAWILMAMTGLVIPNAPAMGLSRHGEAAGTSAALLGAAQFGTGAVIAPLVGVLGGGATAVAIVTMVGVTLALIGLAFARGHCRPSGFDRRLGT